MDRQQQLAGRGQVVDVQEIRAGAVIRRARRMTEVTLAELGASVG
ncbi:hypothetical protein ABZ070_32450 [Streptomyces sp. NPDC006283]